MEKIIEDVLKAQPLFLETSSLCIFSPYRSEEDLCCEGKTIDGWQVKHIASTLPASLKERFVTIVFPNHRPLS